MRKVVKAVVRSTLLEAWTEAVKEGRTLEDSEVRKPVTGEACTGEANTEPAVSATGVTEADGGSEGDDAEGGEPCETTRRARQAVRSRSGAANRLNVQFAPRGSWRAMIVITDTLRALSPSSPERGRTLPSLSAAS